MPENTDMLAAVYARNIDAVYRLCYVYLRSRADAEDAAQSVFVKYLQKQPVFQSTEHETAWLLLTAKNCCRDLLRCWWRRQRVDMDSIPEPIMQEAEVSELLETLLSLPEKYRIPLYLHSIEGYPAKELASLLGCRESTVRTRLQRGREMLKQRLGGINDDDEKNTANTRPNRTAKAANAAQHPGKA